MKIRRIRNASRFACGFRLWAVAAAIALLLAVGCVSSGDTPAGGDAPAGGDELALIWEAWAAVNDRYADPSALDPIAATGGAIGGLLQAGEMAPYPFLAEVGRMRGQIPARIPPGLSDVWRSYQLYRRMRPEGEIGELRAAILGGMLAELGGPPGVHLTPEEYADAREGRVRRLEGSYAGIGASVNAEFPGAPIMLSPFPDSPAAKAGMEAGDELLAVDGIPVEGRTADEVVGLVRGAPGTKVRLRVRRAGEPQPLELEALRGDIDLPSVSRQLAPGGIAYIEIALFRDNTGQQFFEALEALKQLEPLALILDLRANPGGEAAAAAEVAAHFLPPGSLFRTLERRDGAREEQRLAAPPHPVKVDDWLAAVLVNGDTLGEAEALAAALQEAGRAVLVGAATYGRGAEYEFVELSDGSALYLPAARWFTPAGRWLGDGGLQPDLEAGLDNPGGGNQISDDPQFNRAYQHLDEQLPLFR